MNIRPIDLQVMLPHVTDIGKVQATQNQQQIVQQQQFAEQLQRQVDARQSQVEKTKKTEMPRIHREKQEEQEQHTAGGQQHKRDAEKEKSQEKMHSETHVDELDPVRGHNIDIVS